MRAVETAAAESAAPKTHAWLSPQEAAWIVGSSPTLDEGAKGPILSLGPLAPPTQGPMPVRGWEDVEIRFVSDFTFQAVVNGTVQRLAALV